MTITFETLPRAVEEIIERLEILDKKISEKTKPKQEKTLKDPLSEYVSKKEMIGKLASASTLWHWERKGKIKAYGIGGKRYYRREDVENLFKEMKK